MRKQGETDFLGWVSTSRDGLRKTAYLLCGDWFLADDLVQDTLTRLYGTWGAYRRHRGPRPLRPQGPGQPLPRPSTTTDAPRGSPR